MTAEDLLSAHQYLTGELEKLREANTMRLERIAHLLELLGNPQDRYPSIHVTGTSGKGSTCTMTAAILEQTGYRTGLHVSPELQIFNERFQINHHPAPISRLVRLYERIEPLAEQVAKENPYGRPSTFEVMVAMMFTYFMEEKVDVAVVEVGLGGALDATNVLKSKVSVITSIGMDHMRVLGNTIEQITEVKAGIIKPGQVVISGVEQPSARQILAERTAQNGSVFWQIGREFSWQMEGNSSGRFQVDVAGKTFQNLSVPLMGDFQTGNAACAVAAACAFNPELHEVDAREGLAKAVIPGRLERIQEDPLVILDGAHNPDKMRAAIRAVNHTYRGKRRIVVLAIKSTKDYIDILPAALDGASTLICTAFHYKSDYFKPHPAHLLAETARTLAPALDVRVEFDPIAAVRMAIAEAGSQGLVLVTGSLYLAGEVRELWVSKKELLAQAEEIFEQPFRSS